MPHNVLQIFVQIIYATVNYSNNNSLPFFTFQKFGINFFSANAIDIIFSRIKIEPVIRCFSLCIH